MSLANSIVVSRLVEITGALGAINHAAITAIDVDRHIARANILTKGQFGDYRAIGITRGCQQPPHLSLGTWQRRHQQFVTTA